MTDLVDLAEPTGPEPTAPTPAQAVRPASRASSPSTLDYGSVKSILKAAAEVLVPAGFFVSLAYYFGLVRTRKVYNEMGIDESLLDFSTTDYLLRSLGVLLVPIPWLVLATCAAVAWFLALTKLLRGRKLPTLAAAVAVAAAIGAGFWFGLERIHSSGTRPDPDNAVILLGAAVAVAVVIWTAALSKPHGFRFGDRLPTAAVVAVAAAGVLLLSYLAFEAVRAQALQVGADQALEAEDDPGRFSCVQITTDLQLAAGRVMSPNPALTEAAEATPTFQTYEGLRLVVKTGGNYLVFDDQTSPRNGLFLIDEDHVAAIQFAPQRGSDFKFCRSTP